MRSFAVLMLGTPWGWMYLAVFGALVMIGTAGEDRLWQANLQGSAQHQQQTRFTPFPGIW